jgi:gluconate 2-dehydrogenase gamma chain
LHTNPSEPPVEPKADFFTRRALLKFSAATILGASFGVGASVGITRWGRSAAPAYRFFSAAEAGTLIAICEQIIPRDDAPGATDAGVIHYIDRQLCGPFVRHQETYRLGLDAMQKTCMQVYQSAFEQLDFERQTAALRTLEANQAPKEFWENQSQSGFFNLVIEHTRQGFYGSPRHGGNRDYASYRMLGLAYPNLIGQNRYGAKSSINPETHATPES